VVEAVPKPEIEPRRGCGGAVTKAVVLENAVMRCEIVPFQGARVRSLFDKQSGRELLFLQERKPWDPSEYLTSIAGGWDQMFPNDDPWDGFPTHGTVWPAPFSVEQQLGVAVDVACRLPRPEVVVEHRYRLLDAPRRGLRLDTQIRALADVPVFLWATHPMLAVAPGWRIDPGKARIEADRRDPGRATPGVVNEVARGEVLVLPAPAQGWQEVLYVRAPGMASVRSPDGTHETRVLWDTSFFPFLWIVTLSGFLTIDLALVLEPCTSWPYRLDEALANGSAMSLRAGDVRTFWSIVESR
jgi:hypothetical protein